jgi:hypothetical protein
MRGMGGCPKGRSLAGCVVAGVVAAFNLSSLFDVPKPTWRCEKSEGKWNAVRVDRGKEGGRERENEYLRIGKTTFGGGGYLG